MPEPRTRPSRRAEARARKRERRQASRERLRARREEIERRRAGRAPERGAASSRSADASAESSRGAKARARSARAAGVGGPIAVTPTHGERPRPPWHPLPLSEILILTGAVAIVIALRDQASDASTLLAGIAAAAIGTLEVTLREHRSGYRSHTTMLATLPVIVFHSLTLLIVSIFVANTRYVNLGLFAIDLILFVTLFKLARASFLTARTRASTLRR